MPYTCENTE